MFPSLDEIAKRRKRLGLTQKQLARVAGVSQSLIAKIESGKITPSYTKVKAIFQALNSVEREEEISAEEIMNKPVTWVDQEDEVWRAIKLMDEGNYSQLPVLGKGKVVGSISEKTILNKLLEGRNPRDIGKLRVKNVMDEAFPTVQAKTPLTIVSTILRHYPAVLVMSKGEIAGIITKADVLKMVKTK